jgi:NAD(P)-dependent dehydrogenase (short-subunit alcohol dehydrogenase family)
LARRPYVSDVSKAWFITGSSRGLGRAIAEAAVARGDRVAATARNPRTLHGLVTADPDQGVALALELDVTDRLQAEAAVQAAVDAFGRIDVVVNNAGYANVGAIEDFSEEDLRAQVETNLWGVVNVTRAALPVLREQTAGHVIQISSIGGRVTSAGLGPYQMSQFAVEGFSSVLRKEVAPLGIPVTVVEPGGIRTDWAGSSMRISAARSDYDASVGMQARRLREHGPGGAIGDPVKMAQAILRIADADSPPAQLLLGSDAVKLAHDADAARLAEFERWEALSLSTDHDDASEPEASLVSTGLAPATRAA